MGCQVQPCEGRRLSASTGTPRGHYGLTPIRPYNPHADQSVVKPSTTWLFRQTCEAVVVTSLPLPSLLLRPKAA